MADCFIGVDSGTQGTKTLVVDGKTGKILGSASCPHSMIKGLGPGAMEQDPQVWITALERTIKQAIKASGVGPGQIKALGISGQQHGFVPLDAEGKVIRPAKLWCDTSTAAEAEALVKKLGGRDELIRLTGNALPVGFTASKILWMKQREPKNYARLATVLLPHDYLNFYLTGKRAMEAGDASGTGVFDTKTRNWSSAVIEAIDPGLSQALPNILPSSEPLGEISLTVGRRLGLAADTLVSTGGGDNMMGAIGTGNIRPGIVTASLGTSGTIYAYSTRPTIDPTGEVAAFCDSTGAWLPLVCTMNVTVATEIIKSLLKLTHDQLTKLAAAVPPGADGLMLLPYFNGERVPDLPTGKGVWFGATSRNMTPGHMARAAMEGAALGLGYGLNRLRDLGIRPKQIRVTGGGSVNPVWRQILADVFDCEVIGLQTSEGAALGAALQAKWAYLNHKGLKVRLSEIVNAAVQTDPSTLAKPDRHRVKRYRALLDFQTDLSRTLAPLFPRHAAFA
ncbi:MAG: xylulokinase [Candidatus Methylacidiphilales bacterium]